MEEYNVKIMPLARIDALDVIDYMNTLPPEDAALYFEMLTGKIEALLKSPERCALAKDTQLRLRGYRTLPVDIYTVFLVIRGKTVEIRRILFSREKYQWLL